MDSKHEDFYYVEKILKKQTFPTLRYLVKWEGYEISQSTWEPLENLENVRDMIEEFEEEQERRREIQAKKKKANMNMKLSADSSIEKRNSYSEEISENAFKNKDDEKQEYDYRMHRKDKLKNPSKITENYRKHLDENEIPSSVVTAKLIENELYCLVKFAERSDGIVPDDCFILTSELADKFPKILIDFYESKIKFT